MTTATLRDKYLRQFLPFHFTKRKYTFSTRGKLNRDRNKKQTKLTSLESLNGLCTNRACCIDKCLSYFSNDQLVQERVKYLQ
jgi:hypothetical protein